MMDSVLMLVAVFSTCIIVVQVINVVVFSWMIQSIKTDVREVKLHTNSMYDAIVKTVRIEEYKRGGQDERTRADTEKEKAQVPK